MTSLAEWGIAVEIHQPVPEPSPKKYIVLENAEWQQAISMAIQCRAHHPLEPIEIYPLSSGLFTVVREVPE